MSVEIPETRYLSDYRPPDYEVESIDLSFDLHEDHCQVDSRLVCRRNESAEAMPPLVLMGNELTLIHIILDGKSLSADQFQMDDEELIIPDVPERFTLEIRTRIEPHRNTSLEGLYQSGGMFCTQCEAEGFRKITYFPDRPDVMSRYSTTIIADRQKYPVLLSNGNAEDRGTLENGRHWVRWEDPFPKPSYLFALVAGDLLHIEDSFTTRSGRAVKLQIFVEKENIDKCDHAMRCLKQAMAWDEKVYGREYDLDIFMIVAVNDFNMGAMENKGLNIFNASYILARQETATDSDFEKIQGVIAHEYFHNWTGNRITCRDWFQLSLKEGLTIFRDQQFSGDMTSRTVKRIQDVNLIRTIQFAEDAGPMAHPVRPDSYIEINNFYTITVYYKGAELIRMMHTMLGEKRFHEGMDLYFERHDGQAVTTEAFVQAMEDAGQLDLQQFRRWYTQAGTPEVTVSTDYHPRKKRFALTLKQQCPATPGQDRKEPFHIPIKMGLLDNRGSEIPLKLSDPAQHQLGKQILHFKTEKAVFQFEDVPVRPVLSIFRDFSAPVKIRFAPPESDLVFLIKHDSDEFNRWEAAQKLLTGIFLKQIDARKKTIPSDISELTRAYRQILSDGQLDKAIIAQMLNLPSESYLGDQLEVIDVNAVHRTREAIKTALAENLKDDLLDIYHSNKEDGAFSVDAAAVGRRSLKNTALGYLMSLSDEAVLHLCQAQYESASNMTDEMQALTFLANHDYPGREDALNRFSRKWQDDPLVMNIWFAIQAASTLSDVNTIRELCSHQRFDPKNPNKIRALVGTFCSANHIQFHQMDGSGYRFLADQIEQLNLSNPQLAARLLTPLTRWRRFGPKRQGLMKRQIKRILDLPKLSRDVFEIAHKSM